MHPQQFTSTRYCSFHLIDVIKFLGANRSDLWILGAQLGGSLKGDGELKLVQSRVLHHTPAMFGSGTIQCSTIRTRCLVF